MNEMIPPLPGELQRALERYYSSPAPRQEFAARLERQLRQGVELQRRKPDLTGQTPFKRLLYTRPLLAILVALLILLLLSGVVYALGRSLGYIPGIGMIDRSAPLQVLAEPVTVRRAGITLTVEQAVLSAGKTVLVYKVEGIPVEDAAGAEKPGSAPSTAAADGGEDPSSYSFSNSITLEGTPEVSHSTREDNTYCYANERLLLPDGSTLPVTGGDGSGWTSGFERRLEFGALPAGIHAAKLIVSCIDGTAAGALPQNWEVSLQFVPAPPPMTVLPVVELEPPASERSPSALSVERLIETGEGYILIGTFRLDGYPANVIPNGLQPNWIRVTDANGLPVQAFPANGFQFENEWNGEFGWAYEIQGKAHAFPLTVRFETVPVYILNETTEFEWDTGEAPQVGQTWTLDGDLQLAGYRIYRTVIKRASRGYEFYFQVDPDLMLFSPEIVGFRSGTGGGGNDGFGKGEIYYRLDYQGEVPSGKLTVKLGDVQAAIHGPWWVQWSP